MKGVYPKKIINANNAKFKISFSRNPEDAACPKKVKAAKNAITAIACTSP